MSQSECGSGYSETLAAPESPSSADRCVSQTYPETSGSHILTIAVTILVLSKHKTDSNTQFIDASGQFKKETNNNTLMDEHVKAIMDVFDSKANVDHFARSVPYEEVSGDYNLSVSSYVEAKDNREVTNIVELNADLKTTVAKIEQLRAEIDVIVAEIEGEGQDA